MKGPLVRKSPIENALQRYMPTTLRPQILCLCPYLLLAGYPGEQWTYYTTGWLCYWPHMASNVYTRVSGFRSCSWRFGKNKKQTELRLFPTAGPFYFIAVNILSLLPKTDSGKQYIVMETDRYPGLTKAISTAKTTATRITNIFLEQWVATLSYQSQCWQTTGSSLRPIFSPHYSKVSATRR